MPSLLTCLLLLSCPRQTEASSGGEIPPSLRGVVLGYEELPGQDRKDDKFNKHSAHSRNLYQEMPEKSQEFAYRFGADLQPTSTMLRSIKGRLKWKFCPLLLLLGCILVLHCPASRKLKQHDKKCSLVCLVSLDHYFSIRSRCSLVTMLPILQKQNKTNKETNKPTTIFLHTVGGWQKRLLDILYFQNQRF